MQASLKQKTPGTPEAILSQSFFEEDRRVCIAAILAFDAWAKQSVYMHNINMHHSEVSHMHIYTRLGAAILVAKSISTAASGTPGSMVIAIPFTNVSQEVAGKGIVLDPDSTQTSTNHSKPINYID